MKGDIVSQGWERISIDSDLKQKLETFFLDLCSYALIIVDDSSLSNEIDIEALRDAVAKGDVYAAEPLLRRTLLAIAQKDRALLGKLYDLGTRPMKLMSGRELFFADPVAEVSKRFFETSGKRPLPVAPFNGETLHVFPPGQENYRYNLPVHQDYPYLLQSPKQLTFWLNLTDNSAGNAGGVRVYPGTHKLRVARTRSSEHGHYEVATEHYPDFAPDNFVDSRGEFFEMYAIDSLTWHSSLRNVSDDQVRLTLIFRISDIAVDRIPFGVDKTKPSDGTFSRYHPDLYIQD